MRVPLNVRACKFATIPCHLGMSHYEPLQATDLGVFVRVGSFQAYPPWKTPKVDAMGHQPFSPDVSLSSPQNYSTRYWTGFFSQKTHTHTLGRPDKGGCYGPPVRAAHDRLASAEAPFFNCLSVKTQPFFLIGCFTIQPSKLLNTLWALVHVKHTFLEDPTKVDTMGHQPFSPDVSLSSPQNYSTRYWTGFFSQKTHTHTLGRPDKGGCYGPPVRAAHDRLASAEAPFFNCLSVKTQPFFLIGCFTIQPSKLLNTLWALVHVKHTFLEDPTKVDAMGHQFARRMMNMPL